MKTKKRWIALLLTLQMGLGHFYIGEYKKSLFFLLFPIVILWITWYLLQDISFMPFLGAVGSIMIYVYAFIDIWRSFPIEDSPSLKYSRWYYVLAFFIFLYILSLLSLSFFPVKSFRIPASSMSNTLLINDDIIANKQATAERNQVVVFKYPIRPEIFYVKRVVAKGGDEVIYTDGKLLIHFHEGDEYMVNNYPKEYIKKYREKLWVENPYMINNKNIHYSKEFGRETLFQNLLYRPSAYGESAMKPIYLDDKDLEVYSMNDGEIFNALYIKIKDGNYFMMGDNRENSNDSRFWGEVEEKYIFGIAKVVYFSYSDLSRIGTEIK